MSFIGKLAYLVLFPGLVFIAFAGTLARGLLAGMSGAITGGNPGGPEQSLPSILYLLNGECIPIGGPIQALQWLAPAVKLLSLSWVSCAIFGFLPGDVVLVYALLLLSSSADLVLCFMSGNPRVRQNGWPEAVSLLGWSIPLAAVLAGVSLRTGSVSISGLINWQTANGVLLGSTAGGELALAGSWLMFLVALMCSLSMMRLRPFGRGYFSDAPAGICCDISGPPLALLRVAEMASFIVVPLLIVALFLGGGASASYEVVFWGLKLAGLFMLLGLFDQVSARMRADRVLLWLVCAGSACAVVGLVLVRSGVSR